MRSLLQIARGPPVQFNCECDTIFESLHDVLRPVSGHIRPQTSRVSCLICWVPPQEKESDSEASLQLLAHRDEG